MTSFTTAFPRHHPPSQNHRSYPPLPSKSDLWSRLSQPGVLVSVLALSCAVIYQIAHSQAAARSRPLPTFVELLWNTTVYLIPACILYTLDQWVNPPLFPLPMLHPLPTTHIAKSELLQRILRTDQPGGIVASMSQAGRRAYSNTFLPKADSHRPAGLRNWDNSCFQNSIIQALSSLKHMPPYLTALAPGPNGPNENASTTLGALRAFVTELTDPSNNGRTLHTPALLKNMSTFHQQDAQEYFSKLLERVDKDIEREAKAACKLPGLEGDVARDDSVASQHSDDSGYQSLPMQSKAGSELVALRNPLEGLSAQRVACTACGFSDGLSMVAFNCLTLDFDGGVGNYTLDELLDRYVKLEPIQGVDCVKCTVLAYRQGLEMMAEAVPMAAERLRVVENMLQEDGFDGELLKKLNIPDAKKVSSTKTKQSVVARPPPSLAIHMNRSVFDPVTWTPYKNLAAVQFPAVLDIGPWCIGSAQRLQVPTVVPADGDGSHKEEDHAEHWVLDAGTSMVAGGGSTSRISGPTYELRAVVTHYGRHENGHYVCYRKHPPRTPEGSKGLPVGESVGRSPTPEADGAQDDVEGILDDPKQGDCGTLAAAGTDELDTPDMESQWWRLSDEIVIPVREEDVLAQGGVFMLFYDCVDPNSVLITPATTGVATEEMDDQDLVTSSPVEHSRSSPSRSEMSDRTLCNAPTGQDGGISEVRLLSEPANEGHTWGGLRGTSQVSVTELLEEDPQAPEGLPSSVETTEQHTPEASPVALSADEAHNLCRQNRARENLVTTVVESENTAMAEDVEIQDVDEHELSEQAKENWSDVSSARERRNSVATSAGSSVTLAAEEDCARPSLYDDKMDLDEPEPGADVMRVYFNG